jgi:hypothetical protein
VQPAPVVVPFDEFLHPLLQVFEIAVRAGVNLFVACRLDRTLTLFPLLMMFRSGGLHTDFSPFQWLFLHAAAGPKSGKNCEER